MHINQPKLQKSKFPSAVSGEEKKADYGMGKGRFFNTRDVLVRLCAHRSISRLWSQRLGKTLVASRFAMFRMAWDSSTQLHRGQSLVFVFSCSLGQIKGHRLVVLSTHSLRSPKIISWLMTYEGRKILTCFTR